MTPPKLSVPLVVLLGASALLAACGYTSEDRCALIHLDDRASKLPLTEEPPVLGSYGFSRGPVRDLACCHACGWGAGDCAGCGVTCTDERLRAEPRDVGGEYTGACRNFEGWNIDDTSCTVWVREGRVVGVQVLCAQPGPDVTSGPGA